MNQHLDEPQPTTIASSLLPDNMSHEQLSKTPTPTSNATAIMTGVVLNGPPFICNYEGCSNKCFTNKSDFKKHWEKHTKPYICDELGCNSLAFGDKAGLHRHEEERHGKHGGRRYYCSIQSCPRARKGFPRQRNLDSHFRTQHGVGLRTGDRIVVGMSAPVTIVTPKGAEADDTEMGCRSQKETSTERDGPLIVDLGSLKAKLIELEKEKEQLKLAARELSARQTRNEEDIQALLKKAMQIFVE